MKRIFILILLMPFVLWAVDIQLGSGNDVQLGQLAEGLKFHWILDSEHRSASDVFYELTPRVNDGTCATDPPTFTTGVKGETNGALDVNGSGYLTLDDNFSFSTTDFSIAFWLKLDGTGLDVMAGEETDTDNRWLLYSAGGTTNIAFYAVVGGVAKYNIYAADGTLTVGSWVHVGFTFDTAGLYVFYIDGSPVTTYTPTVNAADLDVGGASYIGHREYPSANTSSSAYYDFRVYDRALTAGEVELLYDTYNPNIELGN